MVTVITEPSTFYGAMPSFYGTSIFRSILNLCVQHPFIDGAISVLNHREDERFTILPDYCRFILPLKLTFFFIMVNDDKSRTFFTTILSIKNIQIEVWLFMLIVVVVVVVLLFISALNYGNKAFSPNYNSRNNQSKTFAGNQQNRQFFIELIKCKIDWNR